MARNTTSDKDILYYDGACPLCSAEMTKLKACASDSLELQDIHQLDQSSDLPSKKELLERLHLRTESGEWLTGIDANARAWQHTRFGTLWRILTWPLIRIVSAWAYELWLFMRRRQ